jgi:hypothetical protein
MLQLDIGQSTMERAAFHEAAHAVLVWAHGGQVDGIEISYDDANSEWQGATLQSGLPDKETFIEMLFAGGLGEALFVANVYDPIAWIIDEVPTRTSLLRPFALVQNYDLTFIPQNGGPPKVLRFNPDVFSNDLHRAASEANHNHMNIIPLLTNAITRLNTPKVWRAIEELANQFLLKPPRILTWRFGPDSQIEKKKYSVESSAKKPKEILGG